MRGLLAAAGLVIAGVLLLGAAPAAQPKGMLAFTSDAELKAFLEARKPLPHPGGDDDDDGGGVAESIIVTGSRITSPSASMSTPVNEAADGITNNQVEGVDEGDIIKARGDLLVILRRGRLFTVSLAGGGMKSVDRIDAFAPGDDPDGWYDEMLVAADKVVVIGYDYGRGGTQINRFRLANDGRLSFLDAVILKSDDYYSSRNYASRLIGRQLVVYSERSIWGSTDLEEVLPAMARWTAGQKEPGFKRISTAGQVYAPATVRESEDPVASIHALTRCDLLAEVLDCEATAVLGPGSRTFYVSNTAIYLWLSDRYDDEETLLFRLPLDGSRPSAIRAVGLPVDQFSFEEDGRFLNVLLADDGYGDTMWGPEDKNGERGHALLRLPVSLLGDGSGKIAASRYRVLPRVDGDGTFHNRFAGDYLLYGTGQGWWDEDDESSKPKFTRTLFAAPVDGGPVMRVALPHGVDRIELMGPDAVVVGSTRDAIWFSTILLDDGPVRAGDRYRRGGIGEAESRSHGFYYLPDAHSPDGRAGVLALPVARAARPKYEQLFENSAGMLYLRRRNARFMPLGQLNASDEGIEDDACQVSCTDWYGNARPVFLRGRVYALMGYELVEGRLGDKAIAEVGRISFAPPPGPSKE